MITTFKFYLQKYVVWTCPTHLKVNKSILLLSERTNHVFAMVEMICIWTLVTRSRYNHRILLGGNIFKYIFTTVFLGEKIYLNIFSPSYFWGRKYIQINFFPTTIEKGGKFISSNGWLHGSLYFWYGELSLYQYSEMTLGTEIGETSYSMLTIYPIQSNHCGKGLMMMNTLWPQSRIV